MDISNAFALLEVAVSRSATESVNTPEVLAALDFLARRTALKWPFEQFRKNLAPRGDGELDLDQEGRRQLLNASLNGIKLAVRSEP